MSDPLETVTPFTEVPAAPVEPVAPVQAPVADPQPAAQFQLPEGLQEIEGEGKKYATPEAALQSITHAQHHTDK